MKKHLYIIWTNADPVTAEHMVMMYSTNAKLNDWWDEVTVVVWGATQKLLVENKAVQLKMEIARQAGVEFSACISCARNLNLVDKMEELGIECIRWGQRTSEIIQEGQQRGEYLMTI